MTPERFRIDVPDADLDDLRHRLAHTRLPDDRDNGEWRYGVPRDWLAPLLDHWRERFDWRTEEARINAHEQYRVTIDGVPIHFLRVPGKGPAPKPLVLTHGWPWTFWDWQAVLGPLSDPAAHGGDAAESFDVIVPSLPGFGFSMPLRQTGINVRAIGRLWRRLMTEVLGYDRFFAAGGDWGSMVTAELGHAHADRVLGCHLTLPLLPGLDSREVPAELYAPDEQWMITRNAAARPITEVHVVVQRRDPQTLGYALEDSPAGLAAWLWERRRNWGDPSSAMLTDPDRLCSLASLYWHSRSITSSMRLYAEHHDAPWVPLPGHGGKLIPVPTAVSVAPHELIVLPRALMERETDLRQWTVLPSGGHFLPVEQAAALVEEYRRFARPLR